MYICWLFCVFSHIFYLLSQISWSYISLSIYSWCFYFFLICLHSQIFIMIFSLFVCNTILNFKFLLLYSHKWCWENNTEREYFWYDLTKKEYYIFFFFFIIGIFNLSLFVFHYVSLLWPFPCMFVLYFFLFCWRPRFLICLFPQL